MPRQGPDEIVRQESRADNGPDHRAGDGPDRRADNGPDHRADNETSTASDTGLTASLTILGQTVRHPVDHVECFPAPAHVSTVRFTTDELASVCPVTGQPDLSHVIIEYRPRDHCVESKSLKLYLWSFRDRSVFAEALAAEIAGEIMQTAAPEAVKVTLTQRPRGGIEVQAVAELP